MKSARKPFPLRLPNSIRINAEEFADREGVSLNQFIALAIVEKITRLEHVSQPKSLLENSGSSRDTQPTSAHLPSLVHGK
jgi:hypothetical protein